MTVVGQPTEEDISWSESRLGCTFDEARRKVIRQITSCDVHACPGSGKTTLLVAKLAILARRWSYPDRGILVLSHTNVARREVEARLSSDPSGSRLLAYPHFIGTIQSFVDRFLALPYLREVGVEGRSVTELRIDNDLFAAEAWRRFSANQAWALYPSARGYYKRRSDGGRGIVSQLSVVGSELRLASEGGDLTAESTETYQQLAILKRSLLSDGILRFADMFAFGERAIHTLPFLTVGLQQRFPWVFVDEVQDTSAHQDQLLQLIFGERSIVQRFGDQNQGIFSEEAEATARSFDFQRRSSVDIPHSQRFGPVLAKLVSPLTAVRPQRLEGNRARADRAHMILLFTDETIAAVLPAFGDLILNEWRGGLPEGFVAKAVGFRRSPPTRNCCPGSIRDYWPRFETEVPRPGVPRLRLADTVHWARQLVAEKREYSEAYGSLLDGFCRVLEFQTQRRITRRTFREYLQRGKVDASRLRGLILRLLNEPLDEATWSELTLDILLSLKADQRTMETPFMAWNAPTGGVVATSNGDATNVFVHTSGARTVEIAVSTVHSVKGETHDATLVLETYDHEHDLQYVAPILAGTASSVTKARVRHLKRAFVGLTRAKELACLALHRDHLSSTDSDALLVAGWQIKAVH